MCFHPCPLAHVGWAWQTAGFSRDPQKSSPSFATVPARPSNKAQSKPSVSIPSPRYVRSSPAVIWDKDPGPNPETWLHGFNPSSTNWDQEWGGIECYMMAATYRSQNRSQDKAGITNGIVFSHTGHKAACWREIICEPSLKGSAPHFCTPPTANSRQQILHPKTISCLEIKIKFLQM